MRIKQREDASTYVDDSLAEGMVVRVETWVLGGLLAKKSSKAAADFSLRKESGQVSRIFFEDSLADSILMRVEKKDATPARRW